MGRTLQDVIAEWIAKLNNREIGKVIYSTRNRLSKAYFGFSDVPVWIISFLNLIAPPPSPHTKNSSWYLPGSFLLDMFVTLCFCHGGCILLVHAHVWSHSKLEKILCSCQIEQGCHWIMLRWLLQDHLYASKFHPEFLRVRVYLSRYCIRSSPRILNCSNCRF